MLTENLQWNIVYSYFKEKGYVSHQIDTFNDYINNGIQRVVEESDIVINQPEYKYTISFGKVFIPTPSIIEEDRTIRKILPFEARQRDLTYDVPIYVNIIEKIEYEDKNTETEIYEHKRIIIGRTPIMLLSDKCNLKHLNKSERIKAGETDNDHGGYFLIKGKERVLIGQLRGVYNKPIVIEQKAGEKYKYVCEVRSMSEETGHSVLVQAKIGIDDRTLVFNIPYIKESIPIGILFKALGIIEEKDIYNIIGNLNNHKQIDKYITYIIRDSYFIKTQEEALMYISEYTLHVIKDDKKINYTSQVVENELLPHMGIFATIKEKCFYLGYMVNKLLSTVVGLRTEDDRDNYANKRVEMAGVLCCELFRTLFKRFLNTVEMQIEKKKQRPDIISIISRTNSITSGLKSCFSTGTWSVSKNNYVRSGVSQVLSRLTYGATLSHLRRIMIPIGKEGKNAKIRQIHPSQIMYICPTETPEGQSIGIVLNLSLMTTVTLRIPTVVVKEIIENSDNIVFINDYEGANDKSRIFLNGILMGITLDKNKFIEEMKCYRDNDLLDKQISLAIEDNDVYIYCDEGRFMRPLLTINDATNRPYISESNFIPDWNELLKQNYIQYIDNSEIQSSVIAMDEKDLADHKNDFCEICPSMMLGVMASTIPFPDHNQCIWYNEPVYMHDGTTKKISDVVIGDRVITFNPETQEQYITKVTHTYTNTTQKQLFQITTKSGRKITATFDHQFMTNKGWTRLENLNTTDSLIGISLEPKPVSNTIKDINVLEIKKGTNILTEQLPIVARIIGYAYFSSVFLTDEYNMAVQITFSNDNDLRDFEKDLVLLGINTNSCKISNNKYIYENKLPKLISKFRNIIDVPDWIYNGSDMIKREFIAGFSIFLFNGFNSPTKIFADKITYMLNSLNIIHCKMTCENSNFVYYRVEDMILYYDTINYRYNYQVKIKKGIYVEYIRNNMDMLFDVWKKTVIIKSTTIFVPIDKIVPSEENIISDITVAIEEYQSFLCGDAFCVHNSPRNIYQSSMG